MITLDPGDEQAVVWSKMNDLPKHMTKHFRMSEKVLCSMAAETKSVSNPQSLCNSH